MKSKTLIVLFVICSVLTGITYLTMNQDETAVKQTKMGEKLLPDFPVNDVAKITIQDHENAVILKKGESVWVLENKFNYPADFSKLTDFIKKFNEVKIGSSFKADDAKLARLTLHRPDKADVPDEQKGTHVLLEDKDQKVLADMMMGKARDASAGSGGHYMMLDKDPDIYLVDQSFRFLDKTTDEWIDKDVLDVKADDIEEIRCADPKSGNTVYTLKRAEKGKDPELANVPEGRVAKKSKVDNMFRVLSSLRADDVADPAKQAAETGVADAPYFEFHLFDGTVYKAYPGKALADDAEKFYFKADVSYVAPEAEPEAEKEEKEGEEKSDEAQPTDEPKADEPDQKSEAELSAGAEEQNKRISPWTYVIPKWKHENFVTDVEGLLEEKKEEDATKVDTEPADKAPKPEGKEADSAGAESQKTPPDKNQKPKISGGDSEPESTEAPAEESESKIEGSLDSRAFLLAQAETSESEPEAEDEADEPEAPEPESEPEPEMQSDESAEAEIPEEDASESEQEAEAEVQESEESEDSEGESQEEDPASEGQETE